MLKLIQVSVCLILILLSTNLFAQITFEKKYGDSSFDEAKSVRQTPDGGYIIGGTSLVKLDEQGDLEWSKAYPSAYANLTSDQGYILINNNSKSILFTKVDAQGDSLWNTSFGEGIWANEGTFIEETHDGGFIVTGRYQSVTSSGMLLLKLNNLGNKVWSKTFTEATSAGFNYGQAVQQTADNGYILTGYTKQNYYDSTKNENVFIVKTDSVGTEQWRRFFGGAEDDTGYMVRQDNSGNYLIAGRTNSYGSGMFGYVANMYLIKLDSNGDSLWTNTYGGTYMESATGLWVTNNDEYIISGSSNTFSNGDFDGYVVKTNNNGDTLWTNHYGGMGSDYLSSVQQTSDNGFVFAGLTNEIGSGIYDMYVLKTDSVGYFEKPNSVSNIVKTNAAILAYPNPSKGLVTFKSSQNYTALTIIDVSGKTIYSNMNATNSSTIDLSQHPKGIYFYSYIVEKSSIKKSGKIVIN